MTTSVCYIRKYWPSEIRASVELESLLEISLLSSQTCTRWRWRTSLSFRPPFSYGSTLSSSWSRAAWGRSGASYKANLRQVSISRTNRYKTSKSWAVMGFKLQIPYCLLGAVFLTELSTILYELANEFTPWDEVYNFVSLLRQQNLTT